MPRTLPAALDAVNNGAYQAIFRWKAYTSRAVSPTFDHTKIAGFKISNMELEAQIASSQSALIGWVVQLLRGAVINGTEYLVGTSYYKVHETIQNKKTGIWTVRASLIPKVRLTLAGDDTYKNVITAFCTACALTASFKDPTAAYWSYQFLPAGKQVILNDARLFLNMLQQKYLITASDQEGDVVQFSALTASKIATTSRDADVEDPPFLDLPEIITNRDNEVRYLWRDEDESINFDGTATKRLHNLGYLETSNSPPDIHEMYILFYSGAQVDLRLTTNDVIGDNWDTFNEEYSGKTPFKFTEIFDRRHEPSWYMDAEAINPFQNTEGGALPSTIERVSNYTPLNTSGFDNILSANDNNLQAAMGTIDDHGHVYSKRYFYPFGVYTTINPMTTNFSIPYAASIDRTITYKKLTLTTWVVSPNDGSNYWTISLQRVTDGQIIKDLNTSAVSPTVWNVLTTNTFAISSHSAADKGMRVVCLKTGSPGALYLQGPMLEVEI